MYIYIHTRSKPPFPFLFREGGVVSAKMFAFLTFHFCKRYQTLFFPEPNIVASVTKATTVHSQQLSQCPT